MCNEKVLIMILQLVLNTAPPYDKKHIEKLLTFWLYPKGPPTKQFNIICTKHLINIHDPGSSVCSIACCECQGGINTSIFD